MAELTAWGRNVRAALVLRNLDVADLAPQLNISRRTLERTMRGEREPRPWETSRIEELLGLPAWFIREGIDGLVPDDEAFSRLRLTIERLEALLDVLDPKREKS